MSALFDWLESAPWWVLLCWLWGALATGTLLMILESLHRGRVDWMDTQQGAHYGQ